MVLPTACHTTAAQVRASALTSPVRIAGLAPMESDGRGLPRGGLKRPRQVNVTSRLVLRTLVLAHKAHPARMHRRNGHGAVRVRGGAHELLRVELVERFVERVRFKPGRRHQDVPREGDSAERDRLQHMARTEVEARNAVPDKVV
jgi:hypothetical protein